MMRFLIAAILVTVLFSCRKDKHCHDPSDPDCENYDPCYGKKPVTADFTIGQIGSASVVTPMNKYHIVDSIFPETCALRFRAIEKGAKYTWYLGAEVLHDSVVERNFDTQGKYTVTLIVEKTPNTSCFPNDDGKDTITKTFRLVPNCQLLTAGAYKGIWEGHSTDSFIIKFLWIKRDAFPKTWYACQNDGYVIVNTKKQQTDTIDYYYMVDYLVTNKEAHFYNNGGLDGITGDLYVNPFSKKVAFDYVVFGENIHRRFRGRKL